MQTFLPFVSFGESARVLDNKRLGKQRVEALQILKALRGETKGWRHHPATLMWSGHEDWLAMYHDEMVREWIGRGFRNTMPILYPKHVSTGSPPPPWLMTEESVLKITRSHRSNLLRKDAVFYGKYGWNVPNDLPYHWPVTKEDVALKKVLEFCA